VWLEETVTQSGGNITVWSDKSGNGNNAIASGTPTYSATGMSTGLPAIQLNGTDAFFTSSIPGIRTLDTLDVYMVVQSAAAAAADTNSAVLFGYGNNSNASGPYPAFKAINLSSSTGALSGETVSLVIETVNGVSGRLGSSSYARPANTAQILNVRFSTTGTTVFSNGTAVTLNLAANGATTTANSAPSALGYTIDNNLLIGAVRSSGAFVISPAIKFNKFIVVPSALSIADRQKMEGWLAWNSNLVASLPTGHLYKNEEP
jgi:hypothetical protein